MQPRISVVEDDPEMGQLILTALETSGYQAGLYPTPGKFFDSLIRNKPDLLILDMHLPGMDGKEIVRVLRNNPETRGVFIVAISGEAKGTEDIIKGLKTGADEYMTKPLDMELLLTRIAGFLRRGLPNGNHGPSIMQAGPLTIFPEERTVRLTGKPVSLTRLEYDLLTYFLQHSNRVLTRSLLLETVWGGNSDMTTRTVDKHVESLRKKLGAFGRNFETVVRVGYMLRLS